jgi:predicted O-methyltransferase YrrM
MIPKIELKNIHKELNLKNPWIGSAPGQNVPFKNWKMEMHDAPIFEYIYREFKPRRHLEFGTWYGYGACLVAENCPATIWTINLWEGEKKPTGENIYAHVEVELPSQQQPSTDLPPRKGIFSILSKKATPSTAISQRIFKASDSGELIGRLYREKGFGNRVNQVYCNSLDWDATAYPDSFFDTVLIDGGHGKDIVKNDTLKSMRLLRSGGLMMWHDYCPEEEIMRDFPTCKGVVDAIVEMEANLKKEFKEPKWLFPSFILIAEKI